MSPDKLVEWEDKIKSLVLERDQLRAEREIWKVQHAIDIKELRAEVERLKKSDLEMSGLLIRVKERCDQWREVAENIRDTSFRVLNKFGRRDDGTFKDWTEWLDLRDSIAAYERLQKEEVK